jgi:hypothetical protein
MTMPLVMLGPGGDFVTRYETQGRDLYRIDSTMQQQPDTETAGSFAGYSRMPKRQGKGTSGNPGAESVSVGPDGPIHRGSDVFEHVVASLDAGTYGPQPATATNPGAHAAGIALGKSARAASASASTSAPAPADRSEALLEAAATLLRVQQESLRHLQDLSRAAGTSARTPGTPGNPGTPGIPAAGSPGNSARAAGVASLTPAAGSPAPAHTGAAAAPVPRKSPFVAVSAWPATRAAVAATAKSLTPVTLAAARAASVAAPAIPEIDHEPHAQAVAHSHPHSRPALGSRLLADHAGTGRRIGRQQGYGLRARRSLDQKGRVVAPAQQGSLFGS